MTKTKSISITASLSIGIILVIAGFFVIHFSSSSSLPTIPMMILGLGIIVFGLLHFFIKLW